MRQLQGIRDVIENWMNDWCVPGLAVGIVKDGDVIFSEGFGYRNISQGLKVTPDTLFPIGSVTKSFTTMSLGILVEENILNWDVPIRNYLPDFWMFDSIATEQTTLRDIAIHRTGLPGHYLLLYNKFLTREDVVKRLRYLEPCKDFRMAWQYQNLMYLVAGHLVDQISGHSWEEIVQERIFECLGMVNSNFFLNEIQTKSNYSSPYMLDCDNNIKEIPFKDVEAASSAGGIISNVVDMIKWVLLQLDNDKNGLERLITSSHLKQMQSPLIFVQPSRYEERQFISYGMGWFISLYRGHYMVYHGGNVGGFSALVSLLPQDDIGLVILTNMNDTLLPEIISYNIFDRLLNLKEIDWQSRFIKGKARTRIALEKKKAKIEDDCQQNTNPTHALKFYTGQYINLGYGTLTIELKGDQLKARYGLVSMSLEHYHYNIFHVKVPDVIFGFDFIFISFHTDIDGKIMALSAKFESELKPIPFHKVCC